MMTQLMMKVAKIRELDNVSSIRKALLLAQNLKHRKKSCKQLEINAANTSLNIEERCSAMLALMIIYHWQNEYLKCQSMCQRILSFKRNSEHSLFALDLLKSMYMQMGKEHLKNSIESLQKKISKKMSISKTND